LFVSNSQVIGYEDRLQNDLYCVGWGVKLCLVQSNFIHILMYLTNARVLVLCPYMLHLCTCTPVFARVMFVHACCCL